MNQSDLTICKIYVNIYEALLFKNEKRIRKIICAIFPN